MSDNNVDDSLEWYHDLLAKKADKEAFDDAFHEEKRCGSFKYFNDFVEKCSRDECPVQSIKSSVIYALIDISISGYLLMKENRLRSVDNGSSKQKPADIAISGIQKILNCNKKPNVVTDVFEIDTSELIDRKVKWEAFDGARNRKAYWFSMAFPENTPVKNYQDACRFIEILHGITDSKPLSNADVIKARELIINNFEIANGIDLFRICFIRSKIPIYS